MPAPSKQVERELTPTTRPRNKAEALEMAQRWGTEWSHWNMHLEHTTGDSRNLAFATSAQHDVAEVQRLAALHSMLPDSSEGGEG